MELEKIRRTEFYLSEFWNEKEKKKAVPQDDWLINRLIQM